MITNACSRQPYAAHASAMGEPIYRKMGYSEACRIPLYGFGLG
jgi:hypothetical protein